ncbi:hypothetical protein F4779DRAFT_632465 [Xylariaceae sp. FL0662B]|nr:hypothetical protein F4779DRAFT_632465 [Xylariaceae sp. FL0662B]
MRADGAWKRIQRGLPSVLLGILFVVLDAVSTGILVFPSDGNAFAGLQNQSVSTYIISGILCQTAMTLGGSLFPGALGAMLIEVLPFMRGVASDIRDALGDDNPAVVPTVMVAYAMSSFLIGIVFLALGALRLGRFIAYFPQTVLTGAIGGIGVSLFVLGLELTLPSGDGHSLTLSNAGPVLFSEDHVPLLVASLLPIVFMCFSIRSDTLNRLTRGAVQHPYYVPLYFLGIGALFWIIVGGLGIERIGGLHGLAERGWLFRTGEALDSGNVNLREALNYWSLFNFSLVDMSAFSHAVTNFVLLVVIGVLNLPVYVPALALSLDVPYSMNHELIGQGAANILAGACGSLPNILQLSYSVFFTRAGGGRAEAGAVIFLELILFVVSSYLLLYIPTILASGLVLFLGSELTLEAVWESAKDLIWTEWLVVMTTLFACTFVGFAPGVGVGIAAAMVVYTGWGCWDLRAREGYVDRNATILDQHSRRLRRHLHRTGAESGSGYSRLPDVAPEESGIGIGGSEEKPHPQIRIVQLNGYVFFGVIPSVEARLNAQGKPKDADDGKHQYVIVDMHSVSRVETAAAKVIRTKARDTPGLTVVLCGVLEGSGAAADLTRSGLDLSFATSDGIFSSDNEHCIRVFNGCETAVEWCKGDVVWRENGLLNDTASARELARQKFLDLFSTEWSPGQVMSQGQDAAEVTESVPEYLEVKLYEPQSTIIPRPSTSAGIARLFFVVSGTITFPSCSPGNVSVVGPRSVKYNRDSFRAAVIGAFRRGVDMLMRRWSRDVLELENVPDSGATDLQDQSEGSRSDALGSDKRQASAGDTIYVLPQAHLGGVSGTKRTTVNTTCSPLWDATSHVNMWPVDCAEAVVLEAIRDSCWLVEVCVSCLQPPKTSSSIEQLRKQAIRRVTFKIHHGQ